MEESNKCGTDCEYNEDRQEENKRRKKPRQGPIRQHCEPCVQKEIETEYKIERLRRKKLRRCKGNPKCTDERSVGEWPCIYRYAYLPRFLAEAKLPGWTNHSEYVLSGCPSTKREIAIEVTETIRANDYRAANIAVSLLGHLIDYLGPKDKGSYVKPRDPGVTVSERSSDIYGPGKSLRISFEDFINGNFPSNYQLYRDEAGDFRRVDDVRDYFKAIGATRRVLIPPDSNIGLPRDMIPGYIRRK